MQVSVQGRLAPVMSQLGSNFDGVRNYRLIQDGVASRLLVSTHSAPHPQHLESVLFRKVAITMPARQVNRQFPGKTGPGQAEWWADML